MPPGNSLELIRALSQHPKQPASIVLSIPWVQLAVLPSVMANEMVQTAGQHLHLLLLVSVALPPARLLLGTILPMETPEWTSLASVASFSRRTARPTIEVDATLAGLTPELLVPSFRSVPVPAHRTTVAVAHDRCDETNLHMFR